jgi:hypothetical protein
MGTQEADNVSKPLTSPPLHARVGSSRVVPRGLSVGPRLAAADHPGRAGCQCRGCRRTQCTVKVGADTVCEPGLEQAWAPYRAVEQWVVDYFFPKGQRRACTSTQQPLFSAVCRLCPVPGTLRWIWGGALNWNLAAPESNSTPLATCKLSSLFQHPHAASAVAPFPHAALPLHRPAIPVPAPA